MLRNLRMFASSFVGAIFIILLAVPFVFTDPSFFTGGGGQGSSAISIDGERFYDLDVQEAANSVLAQNGQLVEGNPASLDEARTAQGWARIQNLVVAQVAGNYILGAERDRMGWTASREEIVAQIPNDPTFQVAGQYQRSLAALQLDTAEKEEYYILRRRQEINGQRLVQFASNYAPVYTPAAAVDSSFTMATRLFGFDTVTLLSNTEDVGDPTDAQLQDILDESPENYQTQEYRGFSIIVVDPAQMAQDAALEAILANGSDLSPEDFLAENPEIAENATAKAQELITILQDTQQNGVDVQTDAGLDIRDATLADLAEASDLSATSFEGIDRFGRYAGGSNEAITRQYAGLVEDLFTLEYVDGVSETRVTEGGAAFVLQLDSLEESRPMTFDEAKDRLESLWRYNSQNEAMTARLADSVAAFEDGTQSLGNIASAEGVDLVNVDLVNASQVAQLGVDPTQALNMQVGDTGSTQFGSRLVLFSLREIGQAEGDDAIVTREQVEAGVRADLDQRLNLAFYAGIQQNADIKINDREFDEALNQAVITGNNAGYFDGSVTQESFMAAATSLQAQRQALQGGGGHGGGM